MCRRVDLTKDTQARRKANKHRGGRWGWLLYSLLLRKKGIFSPPFLHNQNFKINFFQNKINAHFFNLRQINRINIWHLPVQNIRLKVGIFAKGQEGNSLTCSSKLLETTLLGCSSQSRSFLSWNYCSTISGCKD